MFLLFLICLCSVFGASFSMDIPFEIPARAGYECKDGKRYFTQTPRETIINHLLSIPTLIPKMADGNTLLHLAATITEMPDLLQDLVERKPELAEQFHVKNAAGHTPLDVQAQSQETANISALKFYESGSESEDTAKSANPRKRFTLAQLQALEEKKYKRSIPLGAPVTLRVLAPIDTSAVNSAASKIERVAVPNAPSRMFSAPEKANLLKTLQLGTHQNNAFRASGLHQAARITNSNYPELMSLLLTDPAMRTFIDATDSQGFTPLARACQAKNQPAIDALLAAGADPADLDLLDHNTN